MVGLSIVSSAAGCGTREELEPLRLEGSRLTVNTRTKEAWEDVQVIVNRQYRVATPSIRSGQRVDISLDAFLDVYGNHFYYQRQQIRDVHLTAKSASGAPVDMHMDFHRSGLSGLADVGVFKKKETQ